MKQTYSVTAFSKRSRKKLQTIYIDASSKESAIKHGTAILKYTFGNRNFDALALPYNPLFDPMWRGWVKAI